MPISFCDSAERTSLARLSSEIILSILALSSQHVSVTASLPSHAVAFHHHQYIPADPVQRCILPTPFLTM